MYSNSTNYYKIKKIALKTTGTVIMFCFAMSLSAQSTAGTLTFSFNQPLPTNPAPNSGTKSILAVWIENNTGTFIKTKYRFVGAVTSDHLPTWSAKSGGTTTNALGASCNVTDATTGATRTVSTTPPAFGARSVTWDGKNVVGTTNGTTVADGVYKVWIESTWVDGTFNSHNEITSFSFTKGTTTVHLTPTGDTYVNTVVLDWIPAALSVEDVKLKEPAVSIYPIPSSGIFNIDLKNQVNEIKVFNLLGKIIYSEKVENNTPEITKKLDLSNFSNGSYIISLTNDFGTSNYEIILNK